MNTIFEIAKFPDGRIMLRVRFHKNSNFWFINDKEEELVATWVPTLKEVAYLKEFLDLINKYNAGHFGD